MPGTGARELLLACWLLGLDRGPRQPRPLASGTVLLKLGCQCTMVENSSQMKEVTSQEGVQLGMFAADGPIVAARLTQLMLEADAKHVALLTDLRNAFNTLPRALMLTELFAHPKLAGLWRIMLWIYGTASLLLIFKPDGSLAAWIFSCEGVRQGCVFGSLAFPSQHCAWLSNSKSSTRQFSLLRLSTTSLSQARQSKCAMPSYSLLSSVVRMA